MVRGLEGDDSSPERKLQIHGLTGYREGQNALSRVQRQCCHEIDVERNGRTLSFPSTPNVMFKVGTLRIPLLGLPMERVLIGAHVC